LEHEDGDNLALGLGFLVLDLDKEVLDLSGKVVKC
jgi:hypothetical protein